MPGQFFPGSCEDLNLACRGSLNFVMRERVSLRCVTRPQLVVAGNGSTEACIYSLCKLYYM